MKHIAKETPLLEVTLRRYEKPTSLGERELVKKLCLSLGLLQPGDSRDVVVDIFCVLLHYRSQKLDLSSEEVAAEVIAYRKKNKLPLQGVASSNIRRQLRRLREIMLVEKIFNAYRVSEFGLLHDIFTEKVEKFLLLAIVSRVKEYMVMVDHHFSDGKIQLQQQQANIRNEETGHKGNANFN